ncbi:MAG: cobalt ECF transporter T component CbiQ [Desulfobacterales bacterium]|nr:cobalt ECF transporter T component CbiQ [Desulfobacterales bacterium]
MITEEFAIGASPVHRIDPRLRVGAAVLFSCTAAVCGRFEPLFVCLMTAVALTVMARLDPRLVVRRLLLVNGLILFLWAVLPLTTEGSAVMTIGPAAVTDEGLLLSARITLKSNAILLALIALVATQPIGTLGHALNRMKMSDKLVHLLLITYRYIFVLEQEYSRLARAARVRSFTPKTRIHTYRTYAYLIGMLFVRAAARAERVHQAMVCRGFSGRFYSLSEFSFTKTDGAWAAGIGAVLLAVGWLEWMPK